ncbi:MAG: cell division protein FtsZ, partial [Actinobacteria bacterium]|nr:cell division protein FtsZ [Actinomycetota bacterium]
LLLNITGGSDLTLFEVNEAAGVISEAADDDANIIFGAVVDERLEGKISITVVATGFGDQVPRPSREAAPPQPRPRELEATRRERPEDRYTGFGSAPSFSAGDFEIPSFVRQPED